MMSSNKMLSLNPPHLGMTLLVCGYTAVPADIGLLTQPERNHPVASLTNAASVMCIFSRV